MKGRYVRQWIDWGEPSPWTANLDMVRGLARLFGPEGSENGGASGSERPD
jgi:hypothetical protein